MPDLTFNTPGGSTVQREMLIAYLNTGTTTNPVWSPVGKRVEDSSASYDWGEETKNDILGKTYTTLKKPTITQDFDPGELDGDDAAQEKIWNLSVRNHDNAGLSSQDMLIVHFYAGSSSAPFAERYSACAVRPTGLGGAGSGTVAMPISVTYGGDRTTGTASKDATTGAITFTPDA